MNENLDHRLVTAWSRELYAFWHHFNDEYLGGRLRRPVIVVSRARRTLGGWDASRRILTIAARHIAHDSWESVLQTLRHEMAHQYADEILDGGEEAPHGPAFRRACTVLRITPQAAAPAGEKRLVSRVQKLLSLGASPNEHEAAAAMRKAHALLLEHNINLVEHAGQRVFEERTLGSVRGRRHAWEYSLSMLLSEFFFVEVIWGPSYDAVRDRRGSLLKVYGSPENVDLAEYVFTYLTRLLPRLWSEYRARRKLHGNRERLRYFDGVLRGLHEKLEAEQRQLQQERGLVYLGDSALQRFFRHLNPRIRTSTLRGTLETAAYQDGRRDGRGVCLRRPVAGEGGIRGRLTGG